MVRIQLLAIDFENSIRDELSVDKRNRNIVYKTNKISEIESKCPGSLPKTNSESYLRLHECLIDGTKKTFILVLYENEYYLYSSEFLEDDLLDSILSDPNEGLFFDERQTDSFWNFWIYRR